MESIIQNKKECFLCRQLANEISYDGELPDKGLHDHHAFFGPNRQVSERHGLKYWLCPTHHTIGNECPHRNIKIDKMLKQIAQRKFEETHTREEFINEFGKSYL